MKVLEKEVERLLCREIKKKGGLCLKFISPSMAGVPDRLVILNGLYLVELKRPDGGKLSPLQMSVHKRLAKAGAPVTILKDREGVLKFVRDISTP